MMIRWTQLALTDFHHACDFIAADNPRASKAIAQRTQEALKKLSLYPHMGRKGRGEATRELIIPQTPFIIVYRLRASEIDVVAFLHAARKWPSPC